MSPSYTIANPGLKYVALEVDQTFIGKCEQDSASNQGPSIVVPRDEQGRDVSFVNESEALV